MSFTRRIAWLLAAALTVVLLAPVAAASAQVVCPAAGTVVPGSYVESANADVQDYAYYTGYSGGRAGPGCHFTRSWQTQWGPNPEVDPVEEGFAELIARLPQWGAALILLVVCGLSFALGMAYLSRSIEKA